MKRLPGSGYSSFGIKGLGTKRIGVWGGGSGILVNIPQLALRRVKMSFLVYSVRQFPWCKFSYHCPLISGSQPNVTEHTAGERCRVAQHY